ncbi:hypothetical protein [Streptomyces hydrogenans]|uniref:hypothetical protein n=1 Tax=Streptomyces hydrogenans TaxID=1873719 RepID=UPI00381B5CE4
MAAAPHARLAAITCAVLAAPLSLLPGDLAIAQLAAHNRPWHVVTTLTAVTATGTGIAPYLVAATAGLTLARHPALARVPRAGVRRLAAVAACLAWLALGQTLRFTLMTLIARPRPPAETWLTHASRYAFPSGHATTSAMTVGLLILALARVRSPHRR